MVHDTNLPLKRSEAASILATKYFNEINNQALLENLTPAQRAEYDNAIQSSEDTQYTDSSDGRPGKSGHTTRSMLNGIMYLIEIENSKPITGSCSGPCAAHS